MRICQVASALAFGAFIIEACGGDLPKVDTSPPPPGLPPDASLPPQVKEGDAATTGLDVRFIKGHQSLVAPACSRVFVTAAKGQTKAFQDTLDVGDVMSVKFPDSLVFDVNGLAVLVVQPFACSLSDKPGAEVSVRRVGDGRDLRWAKGAMHAKMLVANEPELYLGWLDGTAPVAEHKHDHSTEILAAIEAAGTFTLNGQEHRVGNEQVVTVPENTLHSYKPDPGSKLIAVQIYVPPGPEQRFVVLDAAEKDAGSADAGAKKKAQP
jgi:mannose-6-phosphate isomerase-like protein (cupin superfamily)